MISDWLKQPPHLLEEDESIDFEALMTDNWPAADVDPVFLPWHKRAVCRGVGWENWSNLPDERCKEACADCPVRTACLSFALDFEPAFGVWGGMTFEERTQLCPICMARKEPHELACNFPHRLERLARMAEQQELGDPDVAISLRQRPSARTNPECIVARGRAHDTAAAYKDGCRCRAARVARMEQDYANGTRKPGTRGPYKPRKYKEAS